LYFSIFFYGIIFALVFDKYYKDKFSEKNVLLFMPLNKQKD